MTGALVGAVTWLQEQEFDIIAFADATVAGDLPSWSKSARDVATKLATWSVMPHTTVTLPIGLTKALFRRSSELQLNRQRLELALEPYRCVDGAVTGVRLGKLTGGNTTLVTFVPGEGRSPDELRQLLRHWLDQAPLLQAIGRSPGQVCGELYIGLAVWGMAGFRLQQPVEIYPVFVYRDAGSFRRHADALLAEGLAERLPRAAHPGQYVAKQAPALLQGSLLLLPDGRLETRHDVHENRRRWALYKKPRLAFRVFDESRVRRLVSCLTTDAR